MKMLQLCYVTVVDGPGPRSPHSKWQDFPLLQLVNGHNAFSQLTEQAAALLGFYNQSSTFILPLYLVLDFKKHFHMQRETVEVRICVHYLDVQAYSEYSVVRPLW